MQLLANKVAFVTGGGNGIGKAISVALAREGAVVGIADLDVASAASVRDEIREEGGRCLVFQANVTNREEIERCIGEMITEYGTIDILINNVGGTIRKPMIEFSEEEWDSIIDINLKSTFLCSRIAGKVMLKQKSGVVINISSIHSLGGIPRRSPYATAKSAINSFTRTIACEWAADGVRMNAVVPGYILTDGLDYAFKEGSLNRQDMERRTPQGKLGTPQDIADAVVFLASDKARYITGTTLYVDGGYSAYHAPEIATSLTHNI
ncbi:SDR family NAD(P)-dependent oxidoreductase [Cohnella nanjingensis]|uniref:SDR family oxidoreductase n=1 Tax=Cohnella nanjingensis TaxID=1387779 RepID=A0A7X0RNT9_9BACL|nr:SDR family NAD(P)-dependent oxidoreductase [Cohnella nanjingensis]MBB6670776.1 SDR family oxidoreductase [Cohnella nanjingensis]